MTTKIVLQKDWDNLPSGHHSPSPYFSGRGNELKLIESVILTKKSGSVLIGAARGIGKTDLVYKALEESVDMNRRIIPIVFNATQIADLFEESPNLTKAELSTLHNQTLISLVTRTYTVCREILKGDLLKEISTLYFQATSKNYEETFDSTVNLNETKRTEETDDMQKIGVISFSKSSVLDFIKKTIPVTLISPIFFLEQFNKLPIFFRIVSYFTFIVLYVLSQVINFSYDKSDSKRRITSKTKKEDVVDIARTLYLRDNSSGNLEFELKEFLLRLSKSREKYKVVFVVDELDKLGDKSTSLKIIKSFKSLFNHSDALFLFITDTVLFDEVVAARQNRLSNANSTLFNQRIYVNRPTVGDLREYLRKIIASPKGGDRKFEDFIIYNSRMDFFSMPDEIRDQVTSFSKNIPVIDWEGTSDELQKSNKQTVITALLEGGRYLYKEQSNLSKNELLINEAYKVAESTSKLEFPKEMLPELAQLDAESKLKQQFRADIAKYLNLTGIFSVEKLFRAQKQFLVYSPTTLPGKPMGKLYDMLEFEKEFDAEFLNFERFILNIYNFRYCINTKKQLTEISSQLIDGIAPYSGVSASVYNELKKVETNISNTTFKHIYDQEEMKRQTDKIKNYCLNIVQSNTLSIIKNALEHVSLQAFPLTERKESLDKFPSLQNFILSNNIQNLVVRSNLESNYKLTVILFNPSLSLVTDEKNKSELKNNKLINVFELYDSTKESPILNERNIRAKQIINFNLDCWDFKFMTKNFYKELREAREIHVTN